MKIIEISNYLNEQLILDIKAENSLTYVDELHIVESNSTYRYKKKLFNLKKKFNHIFYHKLDGIKLFYKPSIKLSRQFPYFDTQKYSWLNEKIQRDYLLKDLQYSTNDNDILIISDLDEIIDPSFFDEIHHFVRSKQIITIKFYTTMYYFNLFVVNKELEPAEMSHRIFIMTGKYFKKIDSIDKLRILGSANKLKEIYCPKKIMGFHHSWLLSNNLLYKLKNYSHKVEEHTDLKSNNKDYIQRKLIIKIIKEKKNLIGNLNLSKLAHIKLLQSVKKKKINFKSLFL